jgi:hypothetical protein
VKPFQSMRFISRISAQLLVGTGLVTFAATIIICALLPEKNVAVAVAVTGTFIATSFLMLGISKVISGGIEQDVRREQTATAERRSREESEAKYEAAERRLANAQREIARLEAMRINIEALKPIQNLGLLEVETSVTDFQRRVIEPEHAATWWRKGRRDTYLGVIQIPVKAHLGVDLKQVRVSQRDDDRLIVGGLAIVVMTDTAAGAKWLLDEVRTEYLHGDMVVSFRGKGHDRRTKDLSRDHELQVRSRLKEGQDFKVFEAGLIRTTQQVLRALLAPLGKK